MKQSKYLKYTLFNTNGKLILFFLFIGIIGLASCAKDQFSESDRIEYLRVGDPQFKLSNSDMESAYQFYLKEVDTRGIEEGVNPRICNTGVRSIPTTDPGATPMFPFHGSTSITVTYSRAGACIQPWHPCLFVGYITITTLPGQTGDYFVRQAFGNPSLNTFNNVSGSINVNFGVADLPLAVSCSDGARIIIYAKDPSTGTYSVVREFQLLCYPCDIGNPGEV